MPVARASSPQQPVRNAEVEPAEHIEVGDTGGGEPVGQAELIQTPTRSTHPGNQPERVEQRAGAPVIGGSGLSAPVYRAPGTVGASVSSAPDVVATIVPAEVAGMVRAGLGIDAGSVTVQRGRGVAQRAGALGARAFTQQGQVFLPDEAGSLDRRDTQALLVHELVHAAQQRAFGADLPTEESAAGRKLEAAAVAAEQWFLGDGAPPVIEQPPENSGPSQHEQVQRADPPAEAPPEPAPLASWAPVTGFREAPVETAAPDLTEVYGRLDGLDTQVAALRDQPPPFDPEDARVLDRLAGRLYRYIRSRLRAELIVDRERSGLLADLSMRGVR